MKKRKQIMVWLLAAVLAAGMINGCGKKTEEDTPSTETPAATITAATAEELLTQVKENLSMASSIKGKLSMKMAMDYKAQGVEASLECNMEQAVEQTREPEAVHMSGTVDINLAGITVDTETYTVIENGQYVTYTGSSGQWMKQAAEKAGDQGSVTKTLELLLKDPAALTLEQVSGVDGKSLYQVTGRITGENLSGIMSTVGSLLEEDTDTYNTLEAKIVLFVDGASGLPTEISMDFTDSYNAMMQANKDAQGFDEVEITAFTITMSDYEVNTVAEIMVPDEVRMNAIDMDALETAPTEENPAETRDPEEPESKDYEVHQNESGEYILGTDWDESTVAISCPKGFTYDENSDKTWIGFHSKENDGTHTLSLEYHLYTIDDDYGEADLAQYQEPSYAYMCTSGDYAQVSFDRLQTVTAAGKTVSYTKLSYIYLGTIYTEEYNSWTVLPDGRMIQCTMKEESREEPCDRIDTGSVFDVAFGAVEE